MMALRVLSELLQGSLSFDDSGEGSGLDSDSGLEDEQEDADAAAGGESNSSEDEAGPRNTVGDVPLGWYKDEEHIGYDIDGRKIKKRARLGSMEAYLKNADSDTNWCVVKLVRAIRKGWIKFDKPKDEANYYLLWGDDTDTADNKRQGLSYIPAPKPNLPGHEESYNPSVEYVPTQEEIDSYQLMYEEDRPKFIPRRFESLRRVPAYEKALREGFDRCLDLYLCPRTRKKRINIDPESLKPKLPSKKDLRPCPKTCYLEFKGHSGPVRSLSVEGTGQWIASGSSDGTIRVWEVETGRCLKVFNVGTDVHRISWNPSPDRPILAAIVGHDLLLLNVDVGDEETQMRTKQLLHIEESAPEEDGDDKKPAVRWVKSEKFDGITLIHHKVYDLQKAEVVKKLESGLREISSISIHPGGDNVIVGSKDGKLCWFDTDLSTKPYKMLKNHSKDITSVTFHRRYPLFASSSEDCTAYVFYGMVYADLNQNPLIVPLEILRGHLSSDRRDSCLHS
ncbi:hypothetical protein ACQ4PT_016717 [Festuca glaucescens]